MVSQASVLPPPPIRDRIITQDGIISSSWQVWFTLFYSRLQMEIAQNIMLELASEATPDPNYLLYRTNSWKKPQTFNDDVTFAGNILGVMINEGMGFTMTSGGDLMTIAADGTQFTATQSNGSFSLNSSGQFIIAGGAVLAYGTPQAITTETLSHYLDAQDEAGNPIKIAVVS